MRRVGPEKWRAVGQEKSGYYAIFGNSKFEDRKIES